MLLKRIAYIRLLRVCGFLSSCHVSAGQEGRRSRNTDVGSHLSARPLAARALAVLTGTPIGHGAVTLPRLTMEMHANPTSTMRGVMGGWRAVTSAGPFL